MSRVRELLLGPRALAGGWLVLAGLECMWAEAWTTFPGTLSILVELSISIALIARTARAIGIMTSITWSAGLTVVNALPSRWLPASILE